MALPWGGHRRSSAWVWVARPGTDRRDDETCERMALLELVEKDADADLVREMLVFAAERLMELEVEAATGACCGRALAAEDGAKERLPRTRLADPCWAARAGDPQAAPKLRRGSCFPSFLEPRRTAENRRSARSSEGARGRHPRQA